MSLSNRIILVIAVIGLILSATMIYRGMKAPVVGPILSEPARSPYPHSIAGEGVIESLNENCTLSVVFPELVTCVYQKVGDIVKKNDPLFQLDTRRLNAELNRALQEEAAAKTLYENRDNQYSYYLRLKDMSAVSEFDFYTAKYDRELALNQWRAATAAVNIVRTDIERSVTRAPFDGQILQINIKEGEFANVNPFNGIPLIVFGNIESLQLRIDVDESEVWRLKKGAKATAFVRGNASIVIPLEFDYIEPLIVGKKLLTGSNDQQVDTRVLQVIYRFAKKDLPVFVGQMLDVFIEADPYEVVK